MKKLLKNYPLEAGFSVFFILFSIVLNSQFLIGSNINTVIAGHDEYIAVREVYSILHPISVKHFIMAVISGNALYYGRIMFYLDALFAFIPFKIWGITGMVYSIRMVHALAMFCAFVLLVNTFLEKNWQKTLAYVGLSGLYFSLYFVMMPKPEPWQLLFLALFLNQFKKNNWVFGFHYIYLGISYGLKFNVLLLLPIFFILPLLNKGKFTLSENILPGLKSILFFIVGLIVAIPCLVLAPLKPIFLNTYLRETFGGTEKTYDDVSISFLDWFHEGLGTNYLGFWALSYVFFALVFVVLFQQIKTIKQTKDFSSIVLILSGSILMFVIMIKTNRLWPHYIWTAYIFIFIGLLNGFNSMLKSAIGKINISLFIFITMLSFYGFLSSHLPKYIGLSSSKDVSNTNEWSIACISYLNESEKPLKVATDGSILYPFENFVEVDIYNPFNGEAPKINKTNFTWYTDRPEQIWEDSNDVVVLFKRHPEKMIREKSLVYKDIQDKLLQNYIKHRNQDFALDTTFGEIYVYKRK